MNYQETESLNQQFLAIIHDTPLSDFTKYSCPTFLLKYETSLAD
jgi:hypothetical protein